MNNIINITKKNSNSSLQISFILLFLFIFLTILVFNIYKGTKIKLPNLEEELRESSEFHLLKSMGWAFLLTLLTAWFMLSGNQKQGKYGVNKVVRI